MEEIVNSPVLISEAQQAIAQRHIHANITVLDRFGESEGNLTFDGNQMGGGKPLFDSLTIGNSEPDPPTVLWFEIT